LTSSLIVSPWEYYGECPMLTWQRVPKSLN
jgi:hypothetical protein